MNALLTILRYDLLRFARDRLMAIFSLLVLVLYAVIITLVPERIQPTWSFATTEDGAPLLEEVFRELRDREGGSEEFNLVRFHDEEELASAFRPGAKADEDLFVGFAFPPDFRTRARQGERPEVHLYVNEGMPRENQELAEIIGDQIALAALGMAPSLSRAQASEVRIGKERPERSFKEQMRSMMALMILMMEMLALGSLLSKEIMSGTVHALLTTTVSLPTYFGAKIAFGTLLAFSQAWLVTVATGGLSPAPAWITVYLLGGALLFTAGGVIIGTRGRDLMEVMIWGMLLMLPSLIPAVTAILPGSSPLWVMAMPTYPLVMGLLSAGDAAPDLSPAIYVGWTLAWLGVALLVAVVLLRRRLT